ncbi:MAG: DUF6732 family protein [Pseudomonadota bacterium]
MTRLTFFAAIISLTAAPALAHPGHLAEAGGHNHWLTVGAAVLALLIVLGAFVRHRARR